MAEGDGLILNNFKEQLLLKTIDLVNDTIKVALYSVALASDDGAAPVYSTTNEIVASGYTAGGATLSGKAVTQDDTNNWAKWDAADVTWSSLAAAAPVEARIYDDTTPSKWVLILFELATNSNGADYTLAFGANGIMTLA